MAVVFLDLLPLRILLREPKSSRGESKSLLQRPIVLAEEPWEPNWGFSAGFGSWEPPGIMRDMASSSKVKVDEGMYHLYGFLNLTQTTFK